MGIISEVLRKKQDFEMVNARKPAKVTIPKYREEELIEEASNRLLVVWVVSDIQMLHGLKVSFSPSVSEIVIS